MARIKKAKKMIKVHEKKRLRNVGIKSEVKSRVKKIVASPEMENLTEYVKTTIKRTDQAAQKGIIKKNKAARIKSRLMKRVNKAKTSA
ncbi:MAG: 30S ribosomal protein S20 [Armatimonadota bacterium]